MAVVTKPCRLAMTRTVMSLFRSARFSTSHEGTRQSLGHHVAADLRTGLVLRERRPEGQDRGSFVGSVSTGAHAGRAAAYQAH